MQRIGFMMKVKPEKIHEYKQHHAAVWPELLAELKVAGMRNYSLWIREDGIEFGYLECDDWDATCAYLAKSEVHTKWQDSMRDFLDSPVSAESSQPIQMLEMSFLME